LCGCYACTSKEGEYSSITKWCSIGTFKVPLTLTEFKYYCRNLRLESYRLIPVVLCDDCLPLAIDWSWTSLMLYILVMVARQSFIVYIYSRITGVYLIIYKDILCEDILGVLGFLEFYGLLPVHPNYGSLIWLMIHRKGRLALSLITAFTVSYIYHRVGFFLSFVLDWFIAHTHIIKLSKIKVT
jgi:hypothetical protein